MFEMNETERRTLFALNGGVDKYSFDIIRTRLTFVGSSFVK